MSQGFVSAPNIVSSTNNVPELCEKQSLILINQRTSRRVLTTRIPNNFSINLSSEYSDFAKKGTAGKLKQALSMLGVSLTFKWMALQTWDDTEPLEFNISIPLIARENALKEVLNPIIELVSLASPGVAAAGFLIPPGMDILDLLSKKVDESAGIIRKAGALAETGGVIQEATALVTNVVASVAEVANPFKRTQEVRTLLLANSNPLFNRMVTLKMGNLLYFKDVIIKGVSVTFGDSKAKTMPVNSAGIPLMATVQLTLKGSHIYTENELTNSALGRTYSEKYQVRHTKKKAFGEIEAAIKKPKLSRLISRTESAFNSNLKRELATVTDEGKKGNLWRKFESAVLRG